MQVRPQQGSALPLSLVFLAMLSVTGVSAIKMAQADLQLAGAVMDRDTALHAAELALVHAEARLFSDDLTLADFNKQCTNGLCFGGSYTPGENCQQAAVRAAVSDANWQKATLVDIQKSVTAEQPQYLIEFMCFQPIAGADSEVLAAHPAPSAYWQPRFRITSISTGRTGVARSTLETEYLLPAEPSAAAAVKVPAIFATNGSLTTVDGTQVTANYCEFCTKSDVDSNAGNVTFNPSDVSGVTAGDAFANIGWTPTYTQIVAQTGVDGHVYESAAQLVGKKSGNDFFAQYFGTSDKNAIINAGHTIASSQFGLASLGDHKIVVFDGDVDFSGNALSLGASDLVIIIRGNLTLSGSASLPRSALIYVEGDLTANSSDRYTSALAVEGNATVRSSMGFFPATNPLATLEAIASTLPATDVAGAGEAKRTSWRMAAL